MILAKAGQVFELTVNSRQKHFGVKNFEVKTINLADGSVSKDNVEVTEVIENIDSPAEATVAADALAGTKTIKVTDNSLKDGMVFKDENGNMYYIEEVKDDTITTRVPLKQDISTNSKLTQVGNTGIYKVPVNIPAVGKYNVVISNPSVNLRNLAAFVEVVEYTLDDLGNKIDTAKDAVVQKVDSVLEQLQHSDNSDYEIVS